MLSTWKIAPALAARLHRRSQARGMVAVDAGPADEAGKTGRAARWRAQHRSRHRRGSRQGADRGTWPSRRSASSARAATGSAIMAQGAPTLKRVHSSSAARTGDRVRRRRSRSRADAVVFMIYSLNGERCTSSSRLLVQEGIAGKFIEKLTARVKALKVGIPSIPSDRNRTADPRAASRKVCSYFDVAQERRRHHRGRRQAARRPRRRAFMCSRRWSPARTRNAGRRRKKCSAVPHRDPIQGRERCDRDRNGVQYGLTGYVWTGDMGRRTAGGRCIGGRHDLAQLQNVRHLPTPFGGMKSSGIGRDGGDYSFDFYMETEHVARRGHSKI